MMEGDEHNLNGLSSSSGGNELGNSIQAQIEANERARKMFEAGQVAVDGDAAASGPATGNVVTSADKVISNGVPNGSIIGGKADDKKRKAKNDAANEPPKMAEINLVWKRNAVVKNFVKRKKVWIGASGALAMMLLIAIVVVATTLNHRDEVLESSYEEVRAKIVDSDKKYTYDDAISSYEKALKQSDDEEEIEEYTSILSSLYAARAGEAYNLLENGNGDNEDICFAQILADAYEAERLNPTVETAYNIYIYESSFGNIERAFEYLDIAEERGLLSGGGEG